MPEMHLGHIALEFVPDNSESYCRFQLQPFALSAGETDAEYPDKNIETDRADTD